MLPHSVQGKTQPIPHKQTISAKYTMRSTWDLQSTPKLKPKLDLKGPMEHYRWTCTPSKPNKKQELTRTTIYIYYIHMDNYYTLFIDTRLALNRIYV